MNMKTKARTGRQSGVLNFGTKRVKIAARSWAVRSSCLSPKSHTQNTTSTTMRTELGTAVFFLRLSKSLGDADVKGGGDGKAHHNP